METAQKWIKDVFIGKTMNELLTEASRELAKAERDVNFEIHKAEKDEKQKLAEIKVYIKKNKPGIAKQMSLHISRKRAYVIRCHKALTQFSQLRDTLACMKNQNTIATSMIKATKVMTRMNNSLNITSLNNLIATLNKGMISMNVKGELLDQALDQVDNDFDDTDDVEQDADEIFEQICSEIGIQLDEKISSPPSKPPEKNKSPENDEDLDLQERLDRLNKTNGDSNS